MDEILKHHQESAFGGQIIQSNKIYELFESSSDELARTFDGLVRILGFTKKYEGTFYRNGKEYNNVCFYNEREWRYVPDIRLLSYEELPTYVSKESWLDDEQKGIENSKLECQEVALNFEPSDVRYIIVPKERQIHSFVKRIRSIRNPEDKKQRKYDEEAVELLTTRIISTEHILQDF